MARQTYEAWLPEDRQSTVIGRITQVSAVEQYANRVPMNTNTKAYPRSAAMGVDEVPKGSAYGEDVSPNDEIILNAKKFGKVVRIAEEDIDDNVIDLINDRKLAWATAYAKFIDNASLGTSAAPGVGVPFDSVYHRVTTADASTTAPYVANANYMSTTSGTLATYDNFSNFLGLTEDAEFFDDGSMLIIAHPSWKKRLRGVKDANGDPLWVAGLAGTPDTLFGHTVKWSRGAKVTATATASPPVAAAPGVGRVKGTPGNPLMIACNPQFLLLGTRSGPESVVIPGRDGTSALTDETLLKIRVRRAFSVAFPSAFTVLEDLG